MSSDFALKVSVALGKRRIDLDARELARRTGDPSLPGALAAMLIHPQSVHEEGGEGVGVASPPTETVTVLDQPFQNQTVRGREGGPGETQGRELELRAMALADALCDPSSLAFFRRVVETVSPELIREALVAALDVPRRELRRSRGAYFTAVLRRLRRHQL